MTEEQKTKEEHDREVAKLIFKGRFVGQYFDLDKNDNPIRFYPERVSEDLQKIKPIITMRDNLEIYLYNEEKGYYERNGAQLLRELINKMLGVHYREARAVEVIHHITSTTARERDELNTPVYFVNVKNGIINLKEQSPKLLPHSPAYFFTGVLPVDYNPKAKCPNFDRFLEQILPEMIDRIQIQEGFGNCLTTGHEYMVIFFLLGEGANGKTTLLNALRALLGDKNCSKATIRQITYGTWYVAELYGKLVNICGDIGLKELKLTGPIKILTGEDGVFGERKYQKPFPFTNTAKPWVSGNMVPYVYDDTDAFFRRWNIVIFKQKFPKGAPKTKPQIIKELTTKEELSGILNWALDGYFRLHKQKNFTNLKTIDERRKQWKELSQPLLVFLANCITGGDFVTKEDFYLSFKEYCANKGFRIITKSLVGRKMKELGYMEGSMRKEPQGKQHYSWLGIEVKSEFLVEEEGEKEPKIEDFEKEWEKE